MATKTLTITEDAYGRLAALKSDTESFSKAINRLTGKVDLLSVAGLLTEREAEALEKRIKEGRKRSRARMKRIKEELCA